MTEKRFEIVLSGGDVSQYEIIDHEQEQLTIYNNLGNVYFSSALQLCELLNTLHEEKEDMATKKEDAEYELLHLKEKYEELLEEKEKYKKEMLYFKRELQKELVNEAIIQGRRNND